MTDLLSQLQTATEGSRELSDQMLLACGWTYGYDEGLSVWLWRTPAGEIHSPHAPLEDPTCDLQDAVSLVREGWAPSMISWSEESLVEPCNRVRASIVGRTNNFVDGRYSVGEAATPSLALCIAIIKAAESKAEAA